MEEGEEDEESVQQGGPASVAGPANATAGPANATADAGGWAESVASVGNVGPLAATTVVACVPVLLISAWLLFLMFRSTVKQRERGSSYFMLPLALAAIGSIFVGVGNLLIFGVMVGFPVERVEVVEAVNGLGLCLGILSLSYFMLTWLRVAALASNGIAATNQQWIKTFRIVVLVQGALPLLAEILALSSYIDASQPFMNSATVLSATDACLLVTVTMPWLSKKLRALTVAKSQGAAGAAADPVIARLLNLSRVARNSAAISLFPIRALVILDDIGCAGAFVVCCCDVCATVEEQCNNADIFRLEGGKIKRRVAV